MTKHTHKGTCQICGSIQAVNNGTGLIAKHGYTKRWGFFSGTCRGSENLPLQVSCDMVQDSADAAMRFGTQLTDKAVQLNNQTGVEGFYNVYVPATWTTKSKRVWLRVTFVEVDTQHDRKEVRMVPNSDDVNLFKLFDNRECNEMATSPAYRFGFYGVLKGCEDYAKHTRTKRAVSYVNEAKQYFEYYSHQIEVVKNWAPSELIAVK